MPVFNLHLAENQITVEQGRTLLAEVTRFVAGVLGAPLERIRAGITLHRADLWVVGGVAASDDDEAAPFFTMIALEGRPLAERQRLLQGLTEIVVRITGAPRGRVRGCIWRIHPEDWAIGGVPASVLREAEIRARAAAGT